jgi:hypothetical protein
MPQRNKTDKSAGATDEFTGLSPWLQPENRYLRQYSNGAVRRSGFLDGE